MKQRTKEFGLRIIRLASILPESVAARVIARQIIRSGTSVGANYRAACRSRSKPEFIAKLGIVEEECDESLYWLEILADTGIIKPSLLKDLQFEGDALLAIIVSSINTARRNLKVQKKPASPSRDQTEPDAPQTI